MEDLIRRSDAIKGAKRLHNLFSSPFYNRDRVEMIEAYFNDIPSADRPQEWIPCSEILPNYSGYYLVTLRDAFDEIEICVVWFAHEDDYSCGSEWREVTDSDTVLAWMPLPKPYKESDNE